MVAAGGDGARPGFAQVNLVCRDVDATVDFYRRLGVAIPDSPPFHGGTRHVEIEDDRRSWPPTGSPELA